MLYTANLSLCNYVLFSQIRSHMLLLVFGVYTCAYNHVYVLAGSMLAHKAVIACLLVVETEFFSKLPIYVHDVIVRYTLSLQICTCMKLFKPVQFYY